MVKFSLALLIAYLGFIGYSGITNASANIAASLAVLSGFMYFMEFKIKELKIEKYDVKFTEFDKKYIDLLDGNVSKLKTGLENLGEASEQRIKSMENKLSSLSIGTNLANNPAAVRQKYGWGAGEGKS